jgi:hypothetical protein
MPDKIAIDVNFVAKWISNEALKDNALKIRSP